MAVFDKNSRLFQIIAFVLILISAITFWLSLILLQHPTKLTVSTNQWYSLIFVVIGAIILFARYLFLIEPHEEVDGKLEKKLD